MAIDIDQSYYRTGTATVAANGTTVTGQGTQWNSSIRAGDLFGTHVGAGVRIATVNSNTSLTLAYPWKGAAQTAAAYEVQFTPYDTGYYPAVRQLLQTLSSGNVESFAGLSGEPNKVPVFTGSGTLGLRDYIADPNGTLANFAALTLAANRIIATNASGNASLLNSADLPVSTATQTALNGKLNLSGGNLTGMLQVLNGNPLRVLGAASWSNAADFWSNAVVIARDVNVGAFLSWHERTSQFIELSVNVKGYGSDVYFSFKGNGSFTAPGAINGTAKNFEIDHTADPDNYDLRHCATEAPEMLVEYRGIAKLTNGRVTVNVEDHYGVMTNTFKNLWADAHVHALQNQDGFARVKPSRVDGATFDIICEDETCSDNVAWLVMARRNDPYVRWEGCTFTDDDGRLIVEFEKPE